MQVFAALADPVRAQIVDSLVAGPRTVTEIVALFSITQPSISRHLKILRDAGLVSVQPVGRQRMYQIDPAPLRDIDRWLDRYRRLWADRLDALEQHMDKEDPA